jgi:hypothetical protein
LERAKVIMYRADQPPERRPASWPIDVSALRRADDKSPRD